MRCTACGGALETGFIPDFSHGGALVTVWIAGTPEINRSIWETLRTGSGVRVTGPDVRTVEAHRCQDCGRLELYALREPEPGSTAARKG